MMKRSTSDQESQRRVEQQIQRNAERRTNNYSSANETARRNLAARERYVEARALGRSA